jgi:hypothetical protein
MNKILNCFPAINNRIFVSMQLDNADDYFYNYIKFNDFTLHLNNKEIYICRETLAKFNYICRLNYGKISKRVYFETEFDSTYFLGVNQICELSEEFKKFDETTQSGIFLILEIPQLIIRCLKLEQLKSEI